MKLTVGIFISDYVSSISDVLFGSHPWEERYCRLEHNVSYDWKKWHKTYPYKGYTLTNPQYIKDRDELFAKNGNGWWWNDGQGLNIKQESPMQYHRRKRKEREMGSTGKQVNK